jgi:hypothetical protein
MEEKQIMNYLYKPTPLSAQQSSTNSNNNYQTDFVTIAGSDINQYAQVYLLYEMSTDLLAKRFLLNDSIRNLEKFKLLVSYLTFLMRNAVLDQKNKNILVFIWD